MKKKLGVKKPNVYEKKWPVVAQKGPLNNVQFRNPLRERRKKEKNKDGKTDRNSERKRTITGSRGQTAMTGGGGEKRPFSGIGEVPMGEQKWYYPFPWEKRSLWEKRGVTGNHSERKTLSTGGGGTGETLGLGLRPRRSEGKKKNKGKKPVKPGPATQSGGHPERTERKNKWDSINLKDRRPKKNNLGIDGQGWVLKGGGRARPVRRGGKKPDLGDVT